MLARAIFVSGTPLSIVESPLWRDFLNRLRPSYTLPSRKMVSTTLLEKEYAAVKFSVDEQLKNSNVLHLQCDGWSNIRNESIINFVITQPNPFFQLTLSQPRKIAIQKSIWASKSKKSLKSMVPINFTLVLVIMRPTCKLDYVLQQPNIHTSKCLVANPTRWIYCAKIFWKFHQQKDFSLKQNWSSTKSRKVIACIVLFWKTGGEKNQNSTQNSTRHSLGLRGTNPRLLDKKQERAYDDGNRWRNKFRY